MEDKLTDFEKLNNFYNKYKRSYPELKIFYYDLQKIMHKNHGEDINILEEFLKLLLDNGREYYNVITTRYATPLNQGIHEIDPFDGVNIHPKPVDTWVITKAVLGSALVEDNNWRDSNILIKDSRGD